ncbi:M48 family peptidase [Parasaccharibacter sp. TMW 2.1886]|nr:M48 family peptidase [Parasaccharibacter sp. TMW 2.1886]
MVTADTPVLLPPVLWRMSSRARRIILRLDLRRRAIVITLPAGATRQQGLRFLQSQSQWLAQAMADLPPPAVDQGQIWLEGQAIPILPTIILDGRTRLTDKGLHVGHPPEEHARHLLSFLKRRAESLFPPLFRQQSLRMDASPAKFSLRDVKSRWGSCTRQGRIMLSWRLIMAPPDIYTYVMVHELAHLRHFNHGPAFWALVDQYAPGGQLGRKKAEKWLSQNGAHLLAMI